ncbi:4-alpha-N-acetylgalactosaminyltransferase [mine drainage metagenome]|uniref:4-alpha-N-acetylgalactosaminyltransferase n=1 Tax=mine drainage metagenome TaxID=410659 RepID=A0A1J5P247_9ZZZZ
MLFVRLVRLVLRLKPDVIQTWLLQMDILGGLAALLTNTPWLLREPVSGLFWTGGLKTRLRRWIGVRADAIVSNSAGGDAYWADVKPAAQRFVIGNVVPMDEIAAVPKAPDRSLGFSDTRPIIMSAGRLDEQKNFEVMIRGLAKVLDQTGAGAVIFGEGPLRGRLEVVIRDCGMQEKILLPGTVPSIWGALKSARIFISLSRYEGHPNVVLEAMACGCPLIVSDIPSHREFLDETTAVFVAQYEDPGAVASAILEVLENTEATSMRSRAARARLNLGYSVATISGKYESVYETVLARRERKPSVEE